MKKHCGKREGQRTEKRIKWDGVGDNQRQYTGVHTHTHTQKGKRAYGKAALVTTSQEIVAVRCGFINECAVDITAAP